MIQTIIIDLLHRMKVSKNTQNKYNIEWIFFSLEKSCEEKIIDLKNMLQNGETKETMRRLLQEFPRVPRR